MRAETDLLRARLLNAVWRRRAATWLASLLPLLTILLLPAARAIALAATAAWIVWLLADIWRWRQRVDASWAVWLDAAVPALEDSSALLATEPASQIARLQQQRLQARLASVLTTNDYRSIAAIRVKFALIPLLLSLAATGAAWTLHGKQTAGAQTTAAQQGKARAIVDGEVFLRVAPPAYTGAKQFESAASDIQIPQHSEVRWCVRNPAGASPVVELGDGQTLTVTPDCALWRANESQFWRLSSKSSTRYNIRVTPDQAPEVAIIAPKELIQILPTDARTVQLSVSARDDYAVVRASLHMTLARGSGENIRFSDREVPLPASADPRVRNWQKQWTLAELGMEPGDELYIFVRATDNAPDPHTTQSPTYTLRLPAPQAESLESTALPSLVKPETLRSQRQIIIDTEQLVADIKASPSMPYAAQRARSEQIASDQSKLRLRYGQFLGEESSLFGDEHDEHEEHATAPRGGFGSDAGIMAQFGHTHDQEDNATIFDPQTKAVLKRALAAMWDAEKALRAIEPKPALPPEYKALEAIKELQQAERVYLHRTAFVPPAMKEEKRLTGDVVGALSYKREQAAASDNVPAKLRDLIQALSRETPLPALWSKTAREAISTRISDQEQKLSAQRAVQDVQDGCLPCRAELRAWLRGTLTDAPVRLQARSGTDTEFGRAWRGKEQP